VSKPATIYLDTNHLSSLVRAQSRPECAAVLSLIADGSARVVFSLLHAIELSAPTYSSFEQTCEFLDSIPVLWAVLMPRIFDQEVEAGFARAAGGGVRLVRAFATTPAEALEHPELNGHPPSFLLRALRFEPGLREIFFGAADSNARDFDRFKTDAAAVRRPEEPLLSRIQDHLLVTPGGLHLPDPVGPELILERAGGMAAFPAYQLFIQLGLTRLRDRRYRSERNDVVDEWHALYAPYVDAIALDRRTLGRLRSTKLPLVSRATASLAEIPRLVASAVSEPRE
jgi:hypothetical protein